MPATRVTAGRTHADEVPRDPRYRATLTLYVEHPVSGAWCVGVECTHEHVSRVAATACGRRIAQHAERYETLPPYAHETVANGLADALRSTEE